MKYNLTENQKNLLRYIVTLVQEQRIPDTFEITQSSTQMSTMRLLGAAHYDEKGELLGVEPDTNSPVPDGSQGNFDALVKADCLQHIPTATPAYYGRRTFALQALGQNAVATNFADDPPAARASTFTNNFHGPASGFQIGDNNSLTLLNGIQMIERAVEQSVATPEQKAEAKSVISKFIEHPAIVSILGGLSSGAVSQMGK